MQNCFAFVVRTMLRTIQMVRVWKERFDAARVLNNFFKANTRVEIVYTGFKMF